MQGADIEAFIATCRLLCSSSTRCLVAIEQRTAAVYDRYMSQCEAAFSEVCCAECALESYHAPLRELACPICSVATQVTKLVYHSKVGSGNQIQLIAMSCPLAA